MRTILFRGKRVDNGEWVEGNLYISNMSGCYILQCKSFAKETKDGLKMGDKVVSFEVLPESVGQYTGLKDKNGVKIFEGDVVKNRHYSFEIGIDGAQIFARQKGTNYKCHLHDLFFESAMDVIGNIHDKGGDT